MENKIILLDTSVLIDYFRKKNKSKTLLYKLTGKNKLFAISAISEFEIYTGSNELQTEYWNSFFAEIVVYPFDSETSQIAAKLDKNLKNKRKQIDIPDLFIAATAIKNNVTIATLNQKHFERIDGLDVIAG